MKILKLSDEFSVCKVEDLRAVHTMQEFCFTARTDEECSLVCKIQDVPDEVLTRDDGWRAFRIEGELDFSLIGILSNISTLLAEHSISIFAISTYNTDYILTKKEQFDQAIEVLAMNGYDIVEQ